MSKRSGDPEGSLPAEGGPVADKTNPIHRRAPRIYELFPRNEPNSRLPGVPPPPDFVETNPIYRPTIYYLLSTICCF